FLDIQMPKLNGLEFINSISSPPKVIFTTAYREYAIEAFNVDAVDYLLKPIPFTRFLKAVGKAFQDLTPNTDTNKEPNPMMSEIVNDTTISGMQHIFVRADKKMVKIYLNDILFIESLKDYVIIHVPNKRIVTKQKISYLEEKLPEEIFLRIHRSFLVSIPKIEAFSPNHVEITGKELPIGRSYKNVVSKALFTE
ncbi:MAG: LytTR family DNA-binding domain-containing protein, partial [Bacteroidota bacterium]